VFGGRRRRRALIVFWFFRLGRFCYSRENELRQQDVVHRFRPGQAQVAAVQTVRHVRVRQR